MSVMGVVLALLWAALVIMALLPWDVAYSGLNVSAETLAFIGVALPVLLVWGIADSAMMVEASCGPFDDPRECTALAVLSSGAVLYLLGQIFFGSAM